MDKKVKIALIVLGVVIGLCIIANLLFNFFGEKAVDELTDRVTDSVTSDEREYESRTVELSGDWVFVSPDLEIRAVSITFDYESDGAIPPKEDEQAIRVGLEMRNSADTLRTVYSSNFFLNEEAYNLYLEESQEYTAVNVSQEEESNMFVSFRMDEGIDSIDELKLEYEGVDENIEIAMIEIPLVE